MKRIPLVDLLRRKDDPLLQFLKYSLCGGLATGVDFVVFYLLSIFILPGLGQDDSVVQLLGLEVKDLGEEVRSNRYLINRAVTFLISNFVAYTTNVLFVFEAGKHSRRREIGLFYTVSAVSFGTGTALGFALIRFGGWTTTTAFAANIAASVLINYAGRKFLVFNG